MSGLGLKNEWSRLVRRVLPKGCDTPEQAVDVWLTPSRPPWSYVPMKGPYRLIRVDRDRTAFYAFEYYDEISDAVLDFANLHYPRPGEQCCLVDGRDMIVLGWHHCDDLEADLAYAWFGCAFGFHLLAIINPIDAAIYEQLALTEDR